MRAHEVRNLAHSLNPLSARCCFSISAENIRKPKGFLMFSGGKEKQYRAAMGEYVSIKLPMINHKQGNKEYGNSKID